MNLDVTVVLPVLILLMVFSSVVIAVLALSHYRQRRLELRRLRALMGRSDKPAAPLPRRREPVKAPGWMDSLSRLSMPTEAGAVIDTRLKFLRAGFRQPDAPRVYFLLKSALVLLPSALVLVVLLLASPDMPMSRMALMALLVATVGYYSPDYFLRWRAKTRRMVIQRGLPDLVDLMVVALEAGMGLDAAMTRVSREMAESSPVLAEEFYLAALEVRAGAGRAVALRNLALRVDLEDLNALVTMLNQSERFGTSLGESLRVHSEVMRVRRGQRAEEIAAKIPVKMLFPLIFCIFPAIMVVLIGPGFMQIQAAFKNF